MKRKPQTSLVKKNRVMISYCRRNQEFVKKLVSRFEKENFEVWVDWKRIRMAVDWWKEIERGILDCNVFVFCLSPESIESKVCNQEIDYALKCGKRIIPIVVKEGFIWGNVRKDIAKINFIFFTGGSSFDERFKQLVGVLDTDYEHLDQHTEIQRQAMNWTKHTDRNNKPKKEYLIRGEALEKASRWLLEAQKTNVKPEPTDLQCRFIMHSHLEEYNARRKSMVLRGLIGHINVYGSRPTRMTTKRVSHMASSIQSDMQLDVKINRVNHLVVPTRDHVNNSSFPGSPSNLVPKPAPNISAKRRASVYHLRGLLETILSAQLYNRILLSLVVVHVVVSTVAAVMACADSVMLIDGLVITSLVLTLFSMFDLVLRLLIYQQDMIMMSWFVYIDTLTVLTLFALEVVYLTGHQDTIYRQLLAIGVLRVLRIFGVLDDRFKMILEDKNADGAFMAETAQVTFELKRRLEKLQESNAEMKRKLRGLNQGIESETLVTHKKMIEGYLSLRNPKDPWFGHTFVKMFFILDRRTKDPKLSYWRSADLIMQDPEGVIDLSTVQHLSIHPKARTKFEIKMNNEEPQHNYVLMANTEKEASRWVRAMQSVLRKMFASHTSGEKSDLFKARINHFSERHTSKSQEEKLAEDAPATTIGTAEAKEEQDELLLSKSKSTKKKKKKHHLSKLKKLVGRSYNSLQRELVPDDFKEEFKAPNLEKTESKREMIKLISQMHSRLHRARRRGASATECPTQDQAVTKRRSRSTSTSCRASISENHEEREERSARNPQEFFNIPAPAPGKPRRSFVSTSLTEPGADVQGGVRKRRTKSSGSLLSQKRHFLKEQTSIIAENPLPQAAAGETRLNKANTSPHPTERKSLHKPRANTTLISTERKSPNLHRIKRYPSDTAGID